MEDGIKLLPRLFSQVRKHITDLYEDLRDGHNLISLLEVLSGVTLVCILLYFSPTHTCIKTLLSGLTFGAPPGGARPFRTELQGEHLEIFTQEMTHRQASAADECTHVTCRQVSTSAVSARLQKVLPSLIPEVASSSHQSHSSTVPSLHLYKKVS